MLRPSWLIDARTALRAGELDAGEYRQIEDRAVDEALRVQEAAGLDVATDGEIRRDIFFDTLVQGLDGLSNEPSFVADFHNDQGEVVQQITIPFTVTEKVKRRSSPALEEFLASKDRTTLPLKVTIPSPTMMHAYWNTERTSAAYTDPFEMFADAAEVIRGWAQELFDAGCRYVQVDAPEFAESTFVAPEALQARGIDPRRFLVEGSEMLASIGDLSRDPDTILGVHVCKGNGLQSRDEGSYDRVCGEIFPRLTNFDRFHLEYDDERSGSFEPLRNLPEDKVAVLGLVSTKYATLEDPQVLRQRIDDAARFHPKDQLGIAPQCGFASASETAEERKITTETQAAKLKLVADVARDVWG
jgi:5-methyltetrahydropteroyltriglutamate--homocysteine methyltransferase